MTDRDELRAKALRGALTALMLASDVVVARWERGDLAGAVNRLQEESRKAKLLLGETKGAPGGA